MKGGRLKKKIRRTKKLKVQYKKKSLAAGPNKAAWHPMKCMVAKETQQLKSKIHRNVTRGLINKLNISKWSKIRAYLANWSCSKPVSAIFVGF